MPTFKVQGQVYHLIGSLIPSANEDAKFLQIYFMGDSSQECDRRYQNIHNLDRSIVLSLQEMLHKSNTLVQGFKTAIEQPQTSTDFSVIIEVDKRPAGELALRFNAPSFNEVAILIVGQQHQPRDIVIHPRHSRLKRVSETHRCYDALQYALIFWQGQYGYNFNLLQVHPVAHEPFTNKNKKVSSNDFYAYMLMERPTQPHFPMPSVVPPILRGHVCKS